MSETHLDLWEVRPGEQSKARTLGIGSQCALRAHALGQGSADPAQELAMFGGL